MQALNTYGMIKFVMGEMIVLMEKMNNHATRVRFPFGITFKNTDLILIQQA